MKRFGGSLFGGYKKDEVDEYVAFLESELESLKADTNSKLEQQRGILDELRARIDSQSEEKEALSDEITKLRSSAAIGGGSSEELEAAARALEEKAAESAEKDRQLADLKQQLESSMTNLANVQLDLAAAEKKASAAKADDPDMNRIMEATRKSIKSIEDDAKANAQSIENKANEEAERITSQARADAAKYKSEAQAEIQKGIEDVKLAKYDLYEYLVSIKNTQDKLVETYKELGTIINKFPAKMEQLSLDASFDIKTDKNFKWHDYNNNSEE